MPSPSVRTRDSAFRYQLSAINYVSIDGFHTFQTFPTRSGPGFRVGCPGIQPAGVASAGSRSPG